MHLDALPLTLFQAPSTDPQLMKLILPGLMEYRESATALTSLFGMLF